MTSKILLRPVFIAVMIHASYYLQAQSDSLQMPADSTTRYYDMSLDELRSIKSSEMSSELEALVNSLITVASQKGQSSRDSPSAVTLISEEDIKRSGARDLIDVLRQVPGFEFAYDGSSTVGLAVRGNWANEGKVLLQVDGVQMNEIFTGSLSFGNHYPLANISRIEIIRGPGSAIYGGFAELAVINIITKSGREINGGYLSGTYGQMKDGLARRNMEWGIGKQWRDLELSLTGIAGQGNRSDQNAFVRDRSISSFQTTGTYQSLANESETNPFLLNARLSYKSLTLQTIYDNYEVTQLDIVDANKKRFLTKSNNYFTSELRYDWKIAEKFSQTASVFYTHQLPHVHHLPDTFSFSQDAAERIKVSLNWSYNASRRMNFIGGVNYFNDKGYNSTDSIRTVTAYVKSITYDNYAALFQFTGKYRIANVVLGARYEKNSSYGHAFVPRASITRRIDRFHFKLLYSESFRAPTIQNIARGVSDFNSLTPGIRPEKTQVKEIEVGYQISRNAIVTLNAFDTRIKDPIVYASDFGIYTNFSKTGTRGFEVETKYKKGITNLSASYSYYTVGNLEKLSGYSTRTYQQGDSLLPTGAEASRTSVLALPNHRISFVGNVLVSPSLDISTSMIWMSKRYGYDFRPTGGNTYEHYLDESAQTLVAHVFINWKTKIHGLTIAGGVYNLLNSKYNYQVPVYSKTVTSLPAGSREFNLKVAYKLNGK